MAEDNAQVAPDTEPVEYTDMNDGQKQMYDTIARYSQMTVLELFLLPLDRQDRIMRFMRPTVTENRVSILEYMGSIMVPEGDAPTGDEEGLKWKDTTDPHSESTTRLVPPSYYPTNHAHVGSSYVTS
jgi:hypothetical protein